MLNYNLELEKVIKEIKASKSKRVLVQLPDGLKPRAAEIVNKIKKHTDAEIFIWASSNFGACDLPISAKNIKPELIVSFGHSKPA